MASRSPSHRCAIAKRNSCRSPITSRFDVRHQLTGAEELTTPGYFSATYGYGPSGRFTNATEAATGAPGGEVQPRDAEYQYKNEDPEQITALVHADDHVSPYATYQYDEIGDQTLSRRSP